MKLTNLNYQDWADTKDTIQLFLQIVGKIKLKYGFRRNHWWHISYQVTPIGLTSGGFYIENTLTEIIFDFLHAKLTIQFGEEEKSFSLKNASVSKFYENIQKIFKGFGVDVKVQNENPFDCNSIIPFSKDTAHNSFDEKYVQEWLKNLKFANLALKTIQNEYKAKISPVHVFWHSFDIATTLFSGGTAPEMPKSTDEVTRDAYSDEVVSFGWWPGDHKSSKAAFYAYSHPSNKNLNKTNIEDLGANWVDQNGGYLAVLENEGLINLNREDQIERIIEFFKRIQKSAYKLNGWSENNLYYEFK